VEQAAEMPAFSDMVFAGGDGLLGDSFLSLPESEGMYILGPDDRFGDHVNQPTACSATDL